jgi:uncharacterized membrane protein YoaK (UPF0700 family)
MLPAFLLAMIAGYADTVGYLRYQAFAGLMTGNTILFGVEISRGLWKDAAFHAAIMASFVLGVMLSRILLRLAWPVWAALCCAAVLLVVCGFLTEVPAALVLPLAMGMQNSAANRFNGVTLSTVFITGNVQRVGEGLLALLWPSKDPNAPKVEGPSIFALVWFAYALGAGLGALAERLMTYPLLLPAAMLPFIMFRVGRANPRGEAPGPQKS